MAGDSRALRLEVLLAAVDKATAPIKAVMGSSRGLTETVKAAREQLRELEQQNKRLENFRTVARDVSVTGNALQAAQVKVRDLARQIAATDAPSKAMLRNFDAAKREAAQLKDRHAALTQQQQRLRTELAAAGVPLQGMARHQADLRKRITEATSAVARQTEALKRQGEQMKRVAAARKQYDSAMQLRGRMFGSGMTMAAGGGAALWAGARFIQEGVEFSKTMSKVQALTRLDKDSAQLDMLRRQARELGAATMFSATDAARGQAFLAMAGFTPEAIKAAMPGLLDTALAGDMELGRTADIASNILSAFKLDPTKMGDVADVLTKAFTTSNMSLEQLGDTMKFVGPVAAAAGMSLEEAAAMAGLLGNVGLQGSNAGTTLRAMLLRLAAPAGKAAQMMESLGIKVVDAEGNVRNMPLLLKELAQAMQMRGMGSGQRLEILKEVFGERPAAGLSELIAQSGADGLDKYLAIIADHAGAASKTAKTMADNVTGDLDELSSAWSDVRIEVFDANESSLRGLLQSLTSVVGNIAAWMHENPRLTATLTQVAAVVAAIVAAMGALTLAFASIIGPFAIARFGAVLLGPALGVVAGGIKAIGLALVANPIGIAVMAIAGAAYLIYRYWEPIKAFFIGLWDGISAFFSTLPERFASFGAQIIQGLVRGLLSGPMAVKQAIQRVGGNVIGWFREKLGINSPSRVFAELGGFTMAGLTRGLQAAANGPLGAITRTAGQIATAAAVGLAGINPAMAGTAIDTRAPLAAPGAPAVAGGNTYNITINAGPTATAQQLAQLVADEIAEIERGRAARGRSSLSDRE